MSEPTLSTVTPVGESLAADDVYQTASMRVQRFDERIKIIGEQARQKLVGVFFEKDEPGKVSRYIGKVTGRFKDVRHLDTTDGPTPLVVTVRFCPRASS